MIPGPPELLPGRPAAIVDLQTAAGARLVGAQWRYADARVEEVEFVALAGPGAPDPLGPGDVPNRTYDVVPHAQAPDYDDSGWAVLAPEDTMRRLANGRVCFNWYRTTVTVPERVGDFDPTGSTVVFEVVVDDYAEVWVNGEMPLALGMSGGQVAAGFNAPNRVVLTRDARPGERFTIAVFGINGPISASPPNYIWLRSASLEFHRPAPEQAVALLATGFDRPDGPAWTADGALVFSSGANRIYRLQPDVRAVTVFRAKSGGATGLAVSPDGLLTMCRPRAVVRMNPHGDEAVLAEGLNRPHDLVYASDGTLYFTDPPGGVLRWRDGELALVTDALAAPTAIALDGCRLYVADGGTVVRIDLASGARDTVHAGDEPVGGLTVDPDGRLFVCTPRGIHVHSELIELPESPRNAVWAGGDLYVTTTSSIYRIRRNR